MYLSTNSTPQKRLGLLLAICLLVSAEVHAQDVSISVSLPDATLFAGDTGVANVAVSEIAGLATGPFSVTVTFPSVLNIDDGDVALVSSATNGGAIVEASPTVTWGPFSLGASTSATLSVPFLVDTQLAGDFIITATHNLMDADNTNDAAQATVTIPVPFKYPAKAQAISAVFTTLESGLERMILGMFIGSPGVNGAVWCRIPEPDGVIFTVVGMPVVYKTCSVGLPSITDVNENPVYSPLHVNDLWRDDTGASAGRIYMTTWGSEGLYYSDDKGESWVSAEPDLGDGYGGNSGWVNIYGITEDATDGILYISVNNGLVFRSLTNGANWQQVSSLPEGSADTAFTIRSHPTTSGTLFAGTMGKGVYVSTDYGLSWNQLNNNNTTGGASTLEDENAAHIFDLELIESGGVEYLFAATSRGVWRMEFDGAKEWSQFAATPGSETPTGVAPEVRSLEFDAAQNLYAVTWGFGVQQNTAPFGAGTMTSFALRGAEMTFFAISPSGTLYAGTSDGALFEMDPSNPIQSSPTASEPQGETPVGFTLGQNYPNPFNPETTISFSLDRASHVVLEVTDTLGRRVATLVSGLLESGSHQVAFDASRLPSGTYLYRLRGPGGSVSRVLSLVK